MMTILEWSRCLQSNKNIYRLNLFLSKHITQNVGENTEKVKKIKKPKYSEFLVLSELNDVKRFTRIFYV